MQTSADVIIIGLGPTGAVLAHLLGQAGIKTVVFEREAEVYPRPRAVFFDDEICRLLAQVGLHDDLASFSRPVQGMDLVNGAGDVLYRYRPGKAESELGFAEGYMFSQPDLERALRRALDRYPSITQLTGCDVEGVRRIDSGSDAHVDYEVLALGLDGNRQTCRASWVIACDGASSPTRRLIGAELEELGPDAEWLVVDLMLEPGLKAWLDLPEVTVQYCNPQRPATWVPLPDDRCRFEIRVMPDDDTEAMLKPDALRTLLRQWMPADDYEIERAVVYTFHALLADRWQSQGLVIAGDAAHQMPPFLGQGMCSGIRDAANLAWKLALVVTGRASRSLIETYTSERSRHTRHIIDTDLRLGDVIQTTDPAIARARDQQAIDAGGAVPLTPPRFAIGSGVLSTSEADQGVGLPVPARAPTSDEPVWPARFHLIGDLEPSAWARAALDTLGTRYVKHPDASLASWLAARGDGARSVLVRPDTLIAGFIDAPEQLDALLAEWSGWFAFEGAPASQGAAPVDGGVA